MPRSAGYHRLVSRLICLSVATTICATSIFGCAAGNFNFIRSVAKWNNSFSLLPRVLLYIVLVVIPVYPVAGFLDLLIGNTIEFWTGNQIIRASNETFKKDGAIINIAHSRAPLRKTVITSVAANGATSITEIRETEAGAIEVYVDGVKRGEITDIQKDLSTLLTYGADGKSVERRQSINHSQLETQLVESVPANVALLSLELNPVRKDFCSIL